MRVGGIGSGLSPELGEQPEDVDGGPCLGDFAAGDAVGAMRAELDGSAGGGDSSLGHMS